MWVLLIIWIPLFSCLSDNECVTILICRLTHNVICVGRQIDGDVRGSTRQVHQAPSEIRGIVKNKWPILRHLHNSDVDGCCEKVNTGGPQKSFELLKTFWDLVRRVRETVKGWMDKEGEVGGEVDGWWREWRGGGGVVEGRWRGGGGEVEGW